MKSRIRCIFTFAVYLIILSAYQFFVLFGKMEEDLERKINFLLDLLSKDDEKRKSKGHLSLMTISVFT